MVVVVVVVVQCCSLATSRTQRLGTRPLTASTPLGTTSTIISSAPRSVHAWSYFSLACVCVNFSNMLCNEIIVSGIVRFEKHKKYIPEAGNLFHY